MNQFLADAVVDVSDETTLSAPGFLEMLSGGTSFPGLKKFAESAALPPHLADRFSRILIALGIRGDLNDAQIDTDGSSRCKERLFLNFNRDVEIERVVSVDQIGLTFLTLQKFLLPGSTDEGEMQAALKGVHDHDLIICVPGDEMPVEFNGSCRTEGTTDFFIEFVGLRYFGDGPNNMVGMEPCIHLQRVVGKFVQIALSKRLCLKSSLTGCVGSSIANMHCFEQSGLLRDVGF